VRLDDFIFPIVCILKLESSSFNYSVLYAAIILYNELSVCQGELHVFDEDYVCTLYRQRS